MDLKNNAARARNTITMLWIAMAAEGLLVAQYIYGYITYNGGRRTSEILSRLEIMDLATAMLELVVNIITGIVFILWFRRAYFNLHTKVDNLAHGEGWAAGAWFVPILSFFRPYQIAKELFERTQMFLSNGNGQVYDQKWQSTASTWWGLWVVGIILSFIGSKVAPAFGPTVSSDAAMLFYVTSSLLTIPAAFFAIKVVKSYGELEEEMYQVEMNETLVPEK